MANSLFKYYEEMEREGVILYFNGPVSQGVVEGIAQLMRNKMRDEEVGVGSVQRVFSILVEQMQNIVRYSTERNITTEECQGEMAHGQVVVGREEDGRFFVACGNKIRSADSIVITDHIKTLRDMSKEDLKTYYKERRKSISHATSKGAGLGFVEMARKSARPMDFDIIPLDCETSFFSMKVVAQ
ncbi:SiaB family protein kinase [Pseudodesulfovibrio piezophilus]|uniref:Uncharacterized protein n=1 Tax=Pseudodesulfovibrio piezophilus (strain DSM 21447 / JCM 15486 / C1TLV30) TaxID=1322246 RepID=M1WN46_PSEP2|nr:SiaB family protein kinase [Pseudodesulfovibrio piezophilus]CCH50160.1 conserved protein of unknown function [Pseudodesulfovibrio piezophilus C1TLV30]